MSHDDVRAAYDRTAPAWAAGPGPVYRALATELLAASPVSVAGALVLDLGAGTGAASHAALAAGASRVVGLDIADGMLRGEHLPFAPVLGDAVALPFAAGCFDLVVAACCLGHLPHPLDGLREARRVGSAVVASAFEPGWTHPAKAAVDDALVPFGYQPPRWYIRLKRDVEPQVDDPARLAALARAAGYGRVDVRTVRVATGLDTPAALAGWRLGMAHLAPFVNSLAPRRQAEARQVAEEALAGVPPLVVAMVVLAAT